jgi:hypothetical protein
VRKSLLDERGSAENLARIKRSTEDRNAVASHRRADKRRSMTMRIYADLFSAYIGVCVGVDRRTVAEQWYGRGAF